MLRGVCVTLPVGIRAVFWERAFGALGVGKHDNIYRVAFLSGFCFFFVFPSTMLSVSALQWHSRLSRRLVCMHSLINTKNIIFQLNFSWHNLSSLLGCGHMSNISQPCSSSCRATFLF